MIDQILYQARNRMKMLARTFIFGVLFIICAWAWQYNSITFSLIMLFCLYQIFLFKYSTITVYENRVSYQFRNLINFNTEFNEFHFNNITELSFPQPKVTSLSASSILFDLFFQSEENKVQVLFADGNKQVVSWRGNSLEIKATCERVNEIISNP